MLNEKILKFFKVWKTEKGINTAVLCRIDTFVCTYETKKASVTFQPYNLGI